MQTVIDIIAALGGSTTISREERIPLTTIEGWKAANYVPEWRQDTLVKRATKRRIAITKADFPPVTARIPRKDRMPARKPADVQSVAA